MDLAGFGNCTNHGECEAVDEAAIRSAVEEWSAAAGGEGRGPLQLLLRRRRGGRAPPRSRTAGRSLFPGLVVSIATAGDLVQCVSIS